MKYMVIETFAPGKRALVYERFHKKGRMLPDDLHYIDSWVEINGDRCFQLMETSRCELFQEWTRAWEDLVSFEIVELEPKEQTPGEASNQSMQPTAGRSDASL